MVAPKVSRPSPSSLEGSEGLNAPRITENRLSSCFRSDQKVKMAKKDLPEEETEIDLEEIDDIEDLDEEEVLGDEDDDVVVGEDDDDDLEIAVDPATLRKSEDDDDDVPDADDVEASLDVILKERLVVEDEAEDEEVVETDDRGDSNESVLPKQSDEFVCNSCFLVKHANQRATPKIDICRDCV